MPAQIFGTDAVVIMLNRAFNDTSPSNATFKNQVATAGTTQESQYAFAKQYGAGYAGQTADALSTLILGNLGVLPNAALQTALKDYLTSVGVANVGIVALQLGQILSNLENATGDQAVFKAAAAAWNNEVTSAYNYSSNPASTGPSTPGNPAPGTTFTLTGGADTFSPDTAVAANKTTGGDDTFRAVAAGDLATADFIDGGAGNDTLTVADLALAATPVVKNVETINVTTSAGVALDLGSSSGYTAVNFVNQTTGSTLDKVALASKAGFVDSAAAIALTTLNFAGATGAADAATVSLKDALLTQLVVANIETLNIESANGTVAATTTNTLGLNAANVETIVVTGSQALNLTLTKESEVNLKTVDASAATKSFIFTTSGDAAGLVAGFTVKGSTDADQFTFTGTQKNYTITGGTGADTFIVGSGAAAGQLANLAAADIVNDTKLKAAAAKVSDFATGDAISVGNGALAGTKQTLTGVELSDIAAQTTLVAAVGKAAAAGGGAVAGDATAFTYGGSGYVFIDVDGNAALSAGDGLVELTGYTSTVSFTLL